MRMFVGVPKEEGARLPCPLSMRALRSGSDAANEVKSCLPTTCSDAAHQCLLVHRIRIVARRTSPETAGKYLRDRYDNDRSSPWRSAAHENHRAPARRNSPAPTAAEHRSKQSPDCAPGSDSRGHRRNLSQRMDSGVSASRPLRQNIFTGQPLEALGESALHRSQPRLHLPAVKLRTVIGQRDFEIAAHLHPRRGIPGPMFSFC